MLKLSRCEGTRDPSFGLQLCRKVLSKVVMVTTIVSSENISKVLIYLKPRPETGLCLRSRVENRDLRFNLTRHASCVLNVDLIRVFLHNAVNLREN
jgi:hypothetical protein